MSEGASGGAESIGVGGAIGSSRGAPVSPRKSSGETDPPSSLRLLVRILFVGSEKKVLRIEELGEKRRRRGGIGGVGIGVGGVIGSSREAPAYPLESGGETVRIVFVGGQKKRPPD